MRLKLAGAQKQSYYIEREREKGNPRLRCAVLFHTLFSSSMAEDSPLSGKEVLVPKKSPILFRLVLLVFAMLCGVYICFIGLNQFSIGNTTFKFFDTVQVSNESCTKADIKEWEVPYVHYPKPDTYSRAECACNPVRYFAILSTQRSGSGWFETLLNSHMNVSSNGEIFGAKVRRANASTITENLDKLYNLDWVSSASKNECTAAVGLKWMFNQGLNQNHDEILKYFKAKGVSVIFLLRRNLLRRMISMLANIYDHDFKLLNGTHKSHIHSIHEAEILASYKPSINTTTLMRELKNAQKTKTKALKFFNSTRHIVLYYEDVLMNRTKLLDVQDFLRVPRRNLTSKQVKIHRGSFSEHVANWDDVKRSLNGTEFESFLNADYRL